MFVLVTGGAGFIGSHTVETLLSKGIQVRVLDNLSTGCIENIPISHEALEFVKGDVRDQACVADCMKDISHVLHLAAQVSVPVSVQQPIFSHSVNIAGYLNVLDAARNAGVLRVVHASSAAVYGSPVKLPLTEISPAMPLSPYGLEKLVMDYYADLYNKLFGMCALGLRYFNVYGQRQDPGSPYSGVISKFSEWAINRSEFTVYGDGQQTRDFIFVKDVATVNIEALKSGATGVINIGTGSSVTLLDIVKALSKCVGHQIKVQHESPRTGDIPYSSVVPRRMYEECLIETPISLQVGLSELIAFLMVKNQNAR